ncbi:MAG: tetratricopeptide repeat protein [Chitinophagales bacterium]
MKSRNWLMIVFLSLVISVNAQTTEDGIKSLDYENYATARRIFSKLIQQQPGNALNYYYLGSALCDLGKFDSARTVFNAGTQADPKSIYNYAGLGRVALEENKVQEATQYFDKVKSITSSKDITQYLLIGSAYSSAQHPNYEMAITLLSKAKDLNNKNAEVFWLLGKTYEGMNKSGDAVSAYENAAENNPSYAKAYTRLGVIWLSAQNGSLASENFEKAIKTDPAYPPAYREYAEFYFRTGKYDLATQTYEKYRQLADKDDETQFRYAQFLFVTEKYQDALNILMGLKGKIESPYMNRMLGYANYETGNYQEGMENINMLFQRMDAAKIIASDYEYLGKLQMKTGNDSLGIVTMERAIALDSAKYALYDTIGTYYYKQKKYAQAGEFYSKKLKATPKNAPFNELANSYRQAGLAHYLGKNFIESDSVFTRISRLSPQWAVPYLFLARIQLNLDSVDSARSKAFPYYNSFVSKAYADTAHYKRELTEAYQYLGNYNTFYKNYGAALYYYDKVVAFDPANKEVSETMKAIRERYKTSPGNPIQGQKDSAGYVIPAIINGNSVNALYDPAITGIAVTLAGSSLIFGSAGTNGDLNADIVKIGDHSLKNVTVALDEMAKKPVAVGADVLNKMNMVFEYETGSVAQW